MRYFANFAGDEYDGKVVENVGDEVEGLDPGTIAYLIANGRITERGDDDGEGSSLGEEGNTGLAQRDLKDMRRPELIGEARRHFETMIGQSDDDRLRAMVDGARSQAEDSSRKLDSKDLDPASRDAAAGNLRTSRPATADSFVPASVVAGNVEDTVAQLSALSPEQRAQVREAEAARPGGARKGVTEALDTLDA